MRNIFKKLILVLVLSIAIIGCKNKQEENIDELRLQEAPVVEDEKEVVTSNYQLGDHVPNELVCMVNNAYMNAPQIPVPVTGKLIMDVVKCV